MSSVFIWVFGDTVGVVLTLNIEQPLPHRVTYCDSSVSDPNRSSFVGQPYSPFVQPLPVKDSEGVTWQFPRRVTPWPLWVTFGEWLHDRLEWSFYDRPHGHSERPLTRKGLEGVLLRTTCDVTSSVFFSLPCSVSASQGGGRRWLFQIGSLMTVFSVKIS